MNRNSSADFTPVTVVIIIIIIIDRKLTFVLSVKKISVKSKVISVPDGAVNRISENQVLVLATRTGLLFEDRIIIGSSTLTVYDAAVSDKIIMYTLQSRLKLLVNTF